MESKQREAGDSYISSDDGFSSMEKAHLAESSAACDDVASKIDSIVTGTGCEELLSR